MNVGSAAAAASTSDVSSTQSQSRTSSSSKTSEKSFDDEMKTVSASEEKSEETANTEEENKVSDEIKNDSNEKTDKTTNDQKNADDIVPADSLTGTVNFTDFKYHNESQSLLSQNIQSLLNTKDLMTTVNSASIFNYDVINMSDSDANFFANLVQNTDMSMKSISDSVNQSLMNGNTETVQKNVQVSSVLMDKLAESMRTSQPFRIDFDKDVSVIIKVNKDGSLAANFIPGDKAVEQYLRNNISSLRQRFDEQNLPYSELSYSNQNKRQQERRNNKENSNE